MIATVAGLCLALMLGGSKPPSPLEPFGKLDARELPEVSGIVKSRRFDGIFWVHNDSGNAPLLFAIRRDGTIVGRFKVEVANIDWEDIAIDDSGHLYLGDIGNNGGRLPVRAIYQIDEPDPSNPADRPLKALRSWFYRFEDDHRFDAESLVIDDGRAILIAKTNDGRDAELYTLSLDRPATLLKPGVPSRIGVLSRFEEPATGADLSLDGERLAVCSATRTLVYRRRKLATDSKTKEPRGGRDAWRFEAEVEYPACFVEAICWDGRDLILAGEDQVISRLPEAIWNHAETKAARPRSRPSGRAGRLEPETAPRSN